MIRNNNVRGAGMKFKNIFKKNNLSFGMVRVILFYWLLPYLAVSITLFYFTNAKNVERISEAARSSIENAASSSNNRIEEAIERSLQASYDGVIRESYEKFIRDNDETAMYQSISAYLNQTYKYSNEVTNTNLLFNMRTNQQYYTYSNIAGATYSSVGEFRAKSAAAVKLAAKDLGTATKLVNVGEHFFVVRNIVTTNYVPFTTLVMEMNTKKVFESLDNVMWADKYAVYTDDNLVYTSEGVDDAMKNNLERYYEENIKEVSKPSSSTKKLFYDRNKKTTYAVVNINDQKFCFVVRLDKSGISSEQNTYIYIYLIIFVMLIPLLIATFYYFYKNVNQPINSLVNASQKIEEGEYGYETEPFRRNKEFETLISTFNHMSVSLRDAFNRIYAEEVAARDANMKALQAQINPHFLNNTLEIINWKARLSGNEDVSRMISALSLMMNATMNRKNESFITIEEEMKYVDAYLYIIFARFGGKFKFIKDIDESVLQFKIPRLIIQPLVENVVEHSGDSKGNMEGKLIIRGDENFISIRVENNGALSEEDKKRIDDLLSQTSLGKDNKNIGIRNVNLRLKMLYGEESGLTITNETDNLTVSEIKIFAEKNNRGFVEKTEKNGEK